MNIEKVRLNLQSLKSIENLDFGCDSNELQERLDFAYENFFATKGICLISNWKWINISLTESEMLNFSDKLKPSFLFSENIIKDEPFRGIKWVRTSLLLEYQHPGLFITKNTCYVLEGRGVQSHITLNQFYKDFF